MGILITWGDLLFNACPLVDGNASDAFGAATIAIIPRTVTASTSCTRKNQETRQLLFLLLRAFNLSTDRYRLLSSFQQLLTCLLVYWMGKRSTTDSCRVALAPHFARIQEYQPHSMKKVRVLLIFTVHLPCGPSSQWTELLPNYLAAGKSFLGFLMARWKTGNWEGEGYVRNSTGRKSITTTQPNDIQRPSPIQKIHATIPTNPQNVKSFKR